MIGTETSRLGVCALMLPAIVFIAAQNAAFSPLPLRTLISLPSRIPATAGWLPRRVLIAVKLELTAATAPALFQSVFGSMNRFTNTYIGSTPPL